MLPPLSGEKAGIRIRRYVSDFRFRMEIFDEWVAEALFSHRDWLDLGCGRNELIAEFAGTGLRVGVDSFRHPNLVRKSGCHFVQAEAEHLPFREGSLGVVTMRQVVEHLPDPLAVFAELHRVLRAGGRVLVVTTNRLAPLVRIARHMPQRVKMQLLRRLYRQASEDVYPTFHRWNTWRRVRQPPPGFRTVRAALSENPIREHIGLFYVSLLWIRFTTNSALRFYWSNLIVEYEKVPGVDS